MPENKEILAKMVLDAWQKEVTCTNALLCTLTEDLLLRQITPSGNTGLYLLGRMTAMHDQLFPVLGICHAIFPHYEMQFIHHPESACMNYPQVDEVRQAWHNVTIQLSRSFKRMRPGDWNANKFNPLLRTVIQLCCLRGQLTLLK